MNQKNLLFIDFHLNNKCFENKSIIFSYIFNVPWKINMRRKRFCIWVQTIFLIKSSTSHRNSIENK